MEEVKALLEVHGCTYDIAYVGDEMRVDTDCDESSLCRAGTIKEVRGKTTLKIDRSAFAHHLSKRGRVTMDPLVSRIMVNLARIREGMLVLDPFSGTGSILVEAAMVGAHAFAVDLDMGALMTSRANLGNHGDYVQADAAQLPIRSRSVDAIVTDVPYGRMSTSHMGVRYIVQKVLGEIGSTLREGGYMVYAAPSYSMFYGHGHKYITICSMYVHGGLYRDIVVLRKS